MTTNGATIASILMDQDGMHVVPEANVKLDSNSPPLRAFLLGKILDPMQTKDKEAASSGAIPPEDILAYDLEQEDGYLKAIHIKNYGDDRRVLELKNAIRWTLRRMYEKSFNKEIVLPSPNRLYCFVLDAIVPIASDDNPSRLISFRSNLRAANSVTVVYCS